MKQRYLISRSKKTNLLTIKEFAVTDSVLNRYDIKSLSKDDFTLLCIETYDNKMIESAISKGKDALVTTLRTQNMYPIGIYADVIANSVMELYASKNDASTELLFDDRDLLQ